MIEVTKENFEEEVLNSEVPVVLDFWAPWCGPCKMMTPILEEMSVQFQYAEQIKFCKLNIEEVPVSELPNDFAVAAIPTLVIVKDGEVCSKEVGLKTKNAIIAMVEEVL